jgi:hypothetical protein
LFFFDYPKVKHSLGQAALQDPYPAWFMDAQVVVRAANLMAFWLWDTIKPGEPIRPDALLGRSVFSIFAENFKRIPAEQNNEFYMKKSAVVKRLKNELGEDSPLHASFTTAMKDNLQLAQIYKQAVLYPDREWDFIFRIASPGIRGVSKSELLEFQVTMYRFEGYTGFLAAFTPAGATLAVIEEQYSLLTDQYNDRIYIQPDDTQPGNVESNWRPGHSENPYHEYYPTFIQDPLWYIAGENKAMRSLLGESVKGKHFFELFFAPQLRPWLGPLQETSAPRAIRYFDIFTAGFLREAHELHAEYGQAMKFLLQLEDFRNLLEISRKLSMRVNLPENRYDPFYTCRVILPWSISPEIALHFRNLVRCLPKNLLVHTDIWDYQATLVPENYETEVALILLHLVSTAPMQDEDESTTSFTQFLWLLTIMKTIEDRLRMEDGEWEPEGAFGRICEELEARFDKRTEGETDRIIAELREVIERLDSEGMVDKRALLDMLGRFTAVHTHLAMLSAFLVEELEKSRSVSERIKSF